MGFGRLIRSLEDRGVLVLLDPRVRMRRYGQIFFCKACRRIG
jgi:ATP-dependent DNA helicase DinG